MQNILIDVINLAIMKKSNMKLFHPLPLILLFVLGLSVIQCTQSDLGSNNSGTGVGGSLNRFTIVDSFLYVIDQAYVESYRIRDGKMEFISATFIDENIETIFPYDSILLIGGQMGMHLCERSNTGEINVVSSYEHIESCDPVVTDGHLAFVTLSSGCRNQTNQLDILDVSDIKNPVLLKSYPMSHPKGLGIDGKLLFICDTYAGLKIFDRTDPKDIQLLYHFDQLEPYDVIPYKGLLIVMTESRIHQFDYRDESNVFELSAYQLK